MKKIIILLTVIAFLTVSFIGYGYYKAIENLTVKIDGLDTLTDLTHKIEQVGSGKFDGIPFSLVINNKSNKSIKLDNLTVDLVDKNGNVKAKIKSLNNILILPNTDTVIKLEFTDFKIDSLLADLLLNVDSFKYIIKGKLNNFIPFKYSDFLIKKN